MIVAGLVLLIPRLLAARRAQDAAWGKVAASHFAAQQVVAQAVTETAVTESRRRILAMSLFQTIIIDGSGHIRIKCMTGGDPSTITEHTIFADGVPVRISDAKD